MESSVTAQVMPVQGPLSDFSSALVRERRAMSAHRPRPGSSTAGRPTPPPRRPLPKDSPPSKAPGSSKAAPSFNVPSAVREWNPVPSAPSFLSGTGYASSVSASSLANSFPKHDSAASRRWDDGKGTTLPDAIIRALRYRRNARKRVMDLPLATRGSSFSMSPRSVVPSASSLSNDRTLPFFTASKNFRFTQGESSRNPMLQRENGPSAGKAAPSPSRGAG